MAIRSAIEQRLQQAVQDQTGETIDIELETPDNLDHGDYMTTVALELGGQLEANPREIAEELIDTMALPDVVENVQIAGPGYINFTVDRTVLGQEIIAYVQDIDFTEKDEKVVVEHTSPNPNKPLHMGTMRCAILGDTIARIADELGYAVEVQNLINDLGRQSATTVYAYRNFLDELSDEDREEKADFWIGLLYSEAAQHLKTDGGLNAVDQIIRDIEDGDNETADLKDELVEKSVRGQLQTAWRSDVFYDALIFERDIVDSGLYEEGLEQIKGMDRVYEAKNREDEGCIVLDIEDFEDELGELQKPYKILIRSDGTATYVAKDIVLTLWKFGLLDTSMQFAPFEEQQNSQTLWSSGGDQEKAFGNADQIINVIGAEQKYPQKIIQYSLKALGLDEAFNNFDHTHFKFVYLPGKVAYSGREGNWVGKHGDAVMDRAHELALDEVQERQDELDAETQDEIAEHVAIAAVRYFLLKFTREKDINFSFETALDWEGDSGPYLLYSTARAYGILEKTDGTGTFTSFENDIEYKLLRELESYTSVVEEAFGQKEPAKLAHYLKHLAETFNTFYHKSPVMDAETDELQESRIALVAAFAAVMEHGLELLGIEPLEEM
jgi:arginyl-tRNA synthetase